MNWEMFSGGLILIVGAFLIRRFNNWLYSKINAEVGSYNYFEWIRDKMVSIFMVIIGLIVILASFAP